MYILRKLEIKDVECLLATLNNPVVTKYFRFFGHFFTHDEVVKFIQNSFNSKNKHFAISDKSGKYYGTISLKNIDYVSKNAEYAIMLSINSIGNGIAQKATNLLFEYAFKKLGMSKIYFNVISENKRAITFYEKYGFTYEGEFLKHIFINGRFYNLDWYSIFKEDFYKKRFD